MAVMPQGFDLPKRTAAAVDKVVKKAGC